MPNELMRASWSDAARKRAGAAVSGRTAAAHTAVIGSMGGLAIMLGRQVSDAEAASTAESIMIGGAILVLATALSAITYILAEDVVIWAEGRRKDGGKHLRRMRQMRRRQEATGIEIAILLRAECDIRTLQEGRAALPRPNREGRAFSWEALRRTRVQKAVHATLETLLPDSRSRTEVEQAMAGLVRPEWPASLAHERCCQAHHSPALPIPYRRLQQLASDPAWFKLKEFSDHLTGRRPAGAWTPARGAEWEYSTEAGVIAELLEALWGGEDPRIVKLACQLAENPELHRLGPLEAARAAVA